MKRFIILLLLTLTGLTSRSQDTLRKTQSPIIFGNIAMGWAGGKAGGFNFGTAAYYQHNKLLYTIRYNMVAGFSLAANKNPYTAALSPVVSDAGNTLHEFSGMVGYRLIFGDKSISLSAGLSYNVFANSYKDQNNVEQHFNTRNIGVPIEFNYKLFNADKERFKLLGLIPIGKRTGFSRSAGIKLFGAISQNTYWGVGFTYGYGFHKTY